MSSKSSVHGVSGQRIAAGVTTIVLHFALAYALLVPVVKVPQVPRSEAADAVYLVQLSDPTTADMPLSPSTRSPSAVPVVDQAKPLHPIAAVELPSVSVRSHPIDAGPAAVPSSGELVLLGASLPDLDATQPDEPPVPVEPVPHDADGVRLRALIDRNGQAVAVVVEHTQAPPEAIDQVLQRLRAMRFLPARRAGAPISAWVDLALPITEV